MRAFTQARGPDTPDALWLVEHPPVYTQGQAGQPGHLLTTQNTIPVVQTDRGGQITFHGPGQVIAYLLLDLHRRGLKVRELVYRIEQAVLDTLLQYGIAGERRAGAPGIYVQCQSLSQSISQSALHSVFNSVSNAHFPIDQKSDVEQSAKIAALGLKIRQGCSYHGLSLNVNMDLRPFEDINPCGYAGLQTIDMASLGVRAAWAEVADVLVEHMQRIFAL
jgi:lipoyl(octanoyl) transferase